MATIPRELQIALEQAIDAHGLANVVDALSEICHDKAEHVGSTWNDHGLATAWTLCGGKLASTERYIAKTLPA